MHEEWAAAAAMEGRAVGDVAPLETFTFGNFLPLKKKKKRHLHLCSPKHASLLSFRNRKNISELLVMVPPFLSCLPRGTESSSLIF